MSEGKKLRSRTYKQRAKDETWIYSLSHPVTNEVRYIGQTCRSIESRLYEHIREGKKGGSWGAVTHWVKKLLDQGLVPIAREIECVPAGGNWQEAESRWIAHYRSLLGKRLLNLSLGGDGNRGYRYTNEQREKLSKLAKSQGRKPPGNKGRVFDEKARANMSAAHVGKPGTPWTAEHKAKYLASRVYEPWSDEMRKKCMEGRKGYVADENHRRSLSEAAKAAWKTLKKEGFKTSEEERAARRIKRSKRNKQAGSEAKSSE